MPDSFTYPGVYVTELPCGGRAIPGVPTSITAFIGRTRLGPLNDPVCLRSFAEFESRFGGLWRDSTVSYAVQHFFLNGGTDAVVVRVAHRAVRTVFRLGAGGEALTLVAADPGRWANGLQIFVDRDATDAAARFDLTVCEAADGEDGAVRVVETFRDLSVAAADPRFVERVLARDSRRVRVRGAVPAAPPDASALDRGGSPQPAPVATRGTDGAAVGFDQIAHPRCRAARQGIWALDRVDLFNLLCIPPFAPATDTTAAAWEAALEVCKRRRAMLIVDPPASWATAAEVLDGDTGVDGGASPVPVRDANAALYFPRVRLADPLQEGRLETFAPCGLVAAVYARTDAGRGVWRAPAGRDATLAGVRELAHPLAAGDHERLARLGVNGLRTLPTAGAVVWGARTLAGADRLGSEWKYVPVRRLALHLEESLDRGIRWAVFEPNGEPLWARLRLEIGTFLHSLFQRGAFQGPTPREAYFVKVDAETTTRDDLDRGIVTVQVGFAPLKPAEFVVLRIRQRAGPPC